MTQPMEGVSSALRRLAAATGSDDGPLGVQFYVSLDGEPLCDVALGDRRPGGRPVTSDDVFPWMCACKPVTVIALAQLYDQGQLTTDTPVAKIVPEYAGVGKQDVTIHHLLTHTALLPRPERDLWTGDRAAALTWAYEQPLLAAPGERAAYSSFDAWLVLSEVVERLVGTDFLDHIRTHVLEPLDLGGAFFAGPGRTPPEDVLFDRSADNSLTPSADFAFFTRHGWPGVGMWGTAAELARPLECVVAGGTWRGNTLISREAVEHFFTPVRRGIPDESFSGMELTWSRGLCTDPAWFGAHAKANVAGHTADQRTSFVLGDHDQRLVISYVSNTVLLQPSVRRRMDTLMLVGDILGRNRGSGR
ncbi:serine hydrolase domain-containing protein [Streptomyces mesophilus]|uniref:serine hydrolase domain-containing protein n=1 Tax=Streptomyces mesophilus TaxID=1775132 RepID=UPI0033243C31